MARFSASSPYAQTQIIDDQYLDIITIFSGAHIPCESSKHVARYGVICPLTRNDFDPETCSPHHLPIIFVGFFIFYLQAGLTLDTPFGTPKN